jgi:hypothetical protein
VESAQADEQRKSEWRAEMGNREHRRKALRLFCWRNNSNRCEKATPSGGKGYYTTRAALKTLLIWYLAVLGHKMCSTHWPKTFCIKLLCTCVDMITSRKLIQQADHFDACLRSSDRIARENMFLRAVRFHNCANLLPVLTIHLDHNRLPQGFGAPH